MLYVQHDIRISQAWRGGFAQGRKGLVGRGETRVWRPCCSQTGRRVADVQFMLKASRASSWPALRIRSDHTTPSRIGRKRRPCYVRGLSTLSGEEHRKGPDETSSKASREADSIRLWPFGRSVVQADQRGFRMNSNGPQGVRLAGRLYSKCISHQHDADAGLSAYRPAARPISSPPPSAPRARGRRNLRPGPWPARSPGPG